MLNRLSGMIQSLTPRHVTVLVGLLVIVSGTWGLVGLTDTVLEGHTQRFDDRLIRWCVTHRHKPAIVDAARDLTALGGVTVLAMVVSAVVGFLLISHKRGAALLVIVAVGGGLVIGSTLKYVVHRPRPPREYQEAYVFTASYPSGHSMLSAVTYLTLGALLAQVSPGRLLRFYIVAVAVVATFLVGLSRVYLGVHWPTDVLAGWTAGLLWSIICLLVERLLQKQGAVEAEFGATSARQ